MFHPNIKSEGNCVADMNNKFSLDLVEDFNSELLSEHFDDNLDFS